MMFKAVINIKVLKNIEKHSYCSQEKEKPAKRTQVSSRKYSFVPFFMIYYPLFHFDNLIIPQLT